MHKSTNIRRGFAVLMAFTTLVFAASAEEAKTLDAGVYAIDAKLSCYISAMGGQEFGGVYDSARLTVDDSGNKLLTVYFKTTPMNIYTIQFDEFVDADDPATIGFYDTDGVLHTAADENAIVTYTASDDTVSGPMNPQAAFSGDRHYLTSMTFPVTEDMNEIAMWLYINSTVMGLQFCDGNGTASTNAPAQQTKYKGTLTLDWCSALGHDYQEEITRDATCSETGEKALTCSRCGESKTETIPVNDNHAGDTEVRGTVAATCSAAGYTGDTYCLACGKLVKPGEATALDISSHSDADGDGFCDDCGTALGTVCPCGKVHDHSKISGKLQFILHTVTAFLARILSIFGK